MFFSVAYFRRIATGTVWTAVLIGSCMLSGCRSVSSRSAPEVFPAPAPAFSADSSISNLPPPTLLGSEPPASYVPPTISGEERTVLSEKQIEVFKPIVPDHFVSSPVSAESSPLSVPANSTSIPSAAPLPSPDPSQVKVDELTDRIAKLEKALAESEKKWEEEKKRTLPQTAPMPAPTPDALKTDPVTSDKPATTPKAASVKKPVAPKALPAFAIAGVAVSSDKEKIRIEVADSALFVPGSWEFNAEAETTLRKIVGEIRANYPNAVLDIEGHTDNLEIDPSDKTQRHDVASHKTMLIMQYFVKTLRWDASKITTTSFGPSRPVAENGTPEGRARNNRIEIVVSP